MDSMKRLLFWLLEGTKGGPTRLRLLSLLAEKPMNMRQLSLAAGLDYKTVEHHVDLLAKNSALDTSGQGYGQVFFVSDLVMAQKEVAEKIRGDNNGRKKKN